MSSNAEQCQTMWVCVQNGLKNVTKAAIIPNCSRLFSVDPIWR